jgi:tripeptide aminopeptidase
MTVAVMGPPPTLPAAPSTPLELFLALVQVASPSGREGRVLEAIAGWLAGCGVAVGFDGAAGVTGSDSGNLVARRFVSADRPTVLFVAHVDTVQEPGDVVVPVVGDDGVVRSAGETILGADNKSAVAAVLSVLARPQPSHANLVAVFSTCEERGRMGVTALGGLAEEVDFAFPVDGSYPVGTVLESALGQVPFVLRVRGRRAHAAKDPAAGIHAVQAACEIVAGLELGWVGDAELGDSVLNISAVRGGSESNVVPDFAELCGEARAFGLAALEARLDRVRSVAAGVAAVRGVSWELVESREDGAPPFPATAAAGNLAIVERALGRVGVPLVRETCLATLEANFLHGMGMATLGIASGGSGPHSTTESLAVAELDRLVAVLDAVLSEAAAPAG